MPEPSGSGAALSGLLANAPALAGEVGYVASPATVYVEDQGRLADAIAGHGTPDGPPRSDAAATPAS